MSSQGISMADGLKTDLDQSVVTSAAAAIVDVWMGEGRSWRHRLDESEFLESADWASAIQLATAALTAARMQS